MLYIYIQLPTNNTLMKRRKGDSKAKDSRGNICTGFKFTSLVFLTNRICEYALTK